MITFYTVLILQYSISGESLQSKILFPSERECGAAMSSIYHHIYAIDKDSIALCKKTHLISASIRPKARPELLN